MTALVLSSGQSAGVKMTGEFLAQDQVLVAVVTGFAGTGKTTLISELAQNYGEPTVLAPTGKAALRVAQATGIFAGTIHKFLYEPTEDPKTGEPVFKMKDLWDEDLLSMKGKLVLIDEASMIDEEVWSDLQRAARGAGFHILLMGDLFQLPPVYKDKEGKPFCALQIETPFRVNLTEVIRQALDSPIIRASMLLRAGRPEFEAMALLKPIGASKLISSVLDLHRRGGATICFTNQRRHEINGLVRKELGYAHNTVHAGEPLLVTQNNYQLGCYNGEIIDFEGWRLMPGEPLVVTDRFQQVSVNMSFGTSTYKDRPTTVSPEQITGKTEGARVGAWTIRKAARFWYKDHFKTDLAPTHLDANYGYALTCHKSQGSEWPETLIVFDGAISRLKGVEKSRWLYTAITRAKNTTSYIWLKDPPKEQS